MHVPMCTTCIPNVYKASCTTMHNIYIYIYIQHILIVYTMYTKGATHIGSIFKALFSRIRFLEEDRGL